MSSPRRLAPLLHAVLLALVLALLPAGAARAQDTPTPTEVSLTGAPTEVLIDTYSRFTGRLLSNGQPVPGEWMQIQRIHQGAWRTVWQGPTDENGEFLAILMIPFTTNHFRAVHTGGPSYTASASSNVLITGRRWKPQLAIGGDTTLVDETSGTITATWRTGSGRGVPGVVRLYEYTPGSGNWQLAATTVLDGDGTGSFPIRPRVDTYYRLYGLPGRWWEGDHSVNRFVDNRPPGRPWHAPAAAPKPRWLPAQPRAYGNGANVIVSAIPDRVWNQMTGISWHRGCPVGRGGLRLIATNYWGFDGYRHRGSLIVNADRVHKFVGALRDFHAARVPIRSMYRVDRFGYSSRSGGGDDFASMAHDNTSAFNCRWVTGNPGTISPHSWGRSFDINPWENPYHSKVGWLPNAWWPSRSDARVAWRSTSHRVVQILQDNGFRWTYRVSDAHHFDGRTPKEGGYFTG